MTITQMRTLRRAGLEPAAVEILEELPDGMVLRDRSSGLVAKLGKAGTLRQWDAGKYEQIPKRLGEKNTSKGEMIMSCEEMDRMDEEVLQMVNRGKDPSDAALPQDDGEGAAEGRGVEIATPAEPARNDKVVSAAEDREEEAPGKFWEQVHQTVLREEAQKREAEQEAHRAWLRRQRIKAAVWIGICILAAATLLVALFVPAAVPWVVNLGVLSFVVAAAIILDRNIRRWTV